MSKQRAGFSSFTVFFHVCSVMPYGSHSSVICFWVVISAWFVHVCMVESTFSIVIEAAVSSCKNRGSVYSMPWSMEQHTATTSSWMLKEVTNSASGCTYRNLTSDGESSLFPSRFGLITLLKGSQGRPQITKYGNYPGEFCFPVLRCKHFGQKYTTFRSFGRFGIDPLPLSRQDHIVVRHIKGLLFGVRKAYVLGAAW